MAARRRHCCTQNHLSSGLVTQIPRDRVTVVDDPRLQDGMNTNWDIGAMVEHIERGMRTAAAKTLVTFDSYGVSGHPNHRATHRGSLEFAKHRQNVGLYVLVSAQYACHLLIHDCQQTWIG